MKRLHTLLLQKGFEKVSLELTATNHLEVVAKINQIEGRFILDTGASSTCIGNEMASHFKLEVEASEITAAGAGATNMETKLSKKNTIQIGDWKKKNVSIVLFDLTHVNQALEQHNALPVHGILGADILKKANAIIHYKKKCVYLK